jgi:hypothetical protein
MKNNLMIFCLALCMLPTYLHAGTGQNLKPAYQSSQGQNTRSAEPIPAGTIIPISLNSASRSDKTGSRTVVSATVMQDVPLGAGETLRRGSKLTGHVVAAIPSGEGSDEARISFQFDQVLLGDRTVPITTNLRAVASPHAVLEASPQPNSGEVIDYEIEIGGDQISYGEGAPVMVGSQVVGTYASHGVLANPDQNLVTACGVTKDSNARPQASWLFSVNAYGSYGFDDLKILHSGSTDPAGEATLTSNGKAVKLGKGSAMLLRVDGSGPEEAQARTTLSRGAE